MVNDWQVGWERLPRTLTLWCNVYCHRAFLWDQTEMTLHWEHIPASLAPILLKGALSHALLLGDPTWDTKKSIFYINYVFFLKLSHSSLLPRKHCFNWWLPTHLSSFIAKQLRLRRKVLPRGTYSCCFFSLKCYFLNPSISYCFTENYPKLCTVKQQTCIISQVLRVRNSSGLTGWFWLRVSHEV